MGLGMGTTSQKKYYRKVYIYMRSQCAVANSLSRAHITFILFVVWADVAHCYCCCVRESIILAFSSIDCYFLIKYKCFSVDILLSSLPYPFAFALKHLFTAYSVDHLTIQLYFEWKIVDGVSIEDV